MCVTTLVIEHAGSKEVRCRRRIALDREQPRSLIASAGRHAKSRGIGYVGALGSRKTQERRRQHLADLGVRDAEIDQLHGPTGLDIGSRTPAETAVSIVAAHARSVGWQRCPSGSHRRQDQRVSPSLNRSAASNATERGTTPVQTAPQLEEQEPSS
jgi:hypothetical protein